MNGYEVIFERTSGSPQKVLHTPYLESAGMGIMKLVLRKGPLPPSPGCMKIQVGSLISGPKGVYFQFRRHDESVKDLWPELKFTAADVDKGGAGKVEIAGC